MCLAMGTKELTMQENPNSYVPPVDVIVTRRNYPHLFGRVGIAPAPEKAFTCTCTMYMCTQVLRLCAICSNWPGCMWWGNPRGIPFLQFEAMSPPSLLPFLHCREDVRLFECLSQSHGISWPYCVVCSM